VGLWKNKRNVTPIHLLMLYKSNVV